MSTLNDAVEAIRLGKPEEGRQILEELLEVDESNGEIWLWLSTVVDNEEDCEICLENVLALDPHNAAAQKGLEALQAGAFSPHLILDELLEIDEHEAPEPTFIEDFVITDDDLPDDDEIKFPSTMVTETKPKKSGKGCKPNLRIILLAVIALVIVMVLAGLAVMNLFSGSDGDSGGPAGGQTQEIPAGGGTEEQPPPPVATDTPTPIPTNTPTPTITPFKLPTPLPTPEPSPTATQVVAPTPGQ